MNAVHITQPCANHHSGCRMKVETVLPVGSVVPSPRLCVSCTPPKDAA